VFVQTYNPDHYSIRFAKKHDYLGFFAEEIAYRKELGYPPYLRFILFQLAGNVEEKTEQAAQRLAVKCNEILHQSTGLARELEILGPVQAPLPRVKSKYRWQLILRSRKSTPLLEVGRKLAKWGQAELRGSGVSLVTDVDPISLI
jgi:primosomal protein N' (replication factor Y)